MKITPTVLLASLMALTLACGYSHKNTPPAVGNIPAITQLVPDNTNAGGGDFTLTVNGSNFNSDAVVKWNGTSQTTTHVSAMQLTAVIPAADIATSGSASVKVTNPGTPGGPYGGGTQSEDSNTMAFTIN